MSDARPAPFRRRLALLLGAVGLALAALGLYLLWHPGRPDSPVVEPPADPRLEYAGPFRNVHPSVRYIPNERCADCHADIAKTYARHPMGRSLVPIARSAALPMGAESNNPFEALGSLFRVERDGDRVWHRRVRAGPDGRTAAETRTEVQYAVGSGTRGYSYLTSRDGFLFQTPVSWYSQKRRWDLSPGFAASHLTGRAVTAECLFCHADRSNPVPDTVNRYEEPVFAGCAIGCQRCHGPGELHVAGPGAGKGPDSIDPTIVNPRHLDRPLREAVCEQCHLQGQVRVLCRGRGVYDFRPGLPLESFLATFVAADGTGKGQQAVGQVEQMYQSRCFQATDGPRGLGCISCHDPHQAVAPEERVSHYRARCLACHDRHGCSLPKPERLKQSAADCCIDCHMPRYGSADIPHTAITDHRILRTGKPGPPKADRPAGGLPIVSFYRGRKGVDEAADERSQAVALVDLAYVGKVDTYTALRFAQPTLERVLERNPGDRHARMASGLADAMRSKWADALAAFEAVLAGSPGHEAALAGAAAAAEALGRPDAARGYWRRAVAVNPVSPEYRRFLARLLMKQGAFGEALPECDAWVRADPFSAEAGAARVECLLAAGRAADARAEFARVEALTPPNLDELRIRFADRLMGTTPPSRGRP